MTNPRTQDLLDICDRVIDEDKYVEYAACFTGA